MIATKEEKIKYDLAKQPLFICYATLLQEFYLNNKSQLDTNFGKVIIQFMGNFCDKFELDRGHAKVIEAMTHELIKDSWQALLADIATMNEREMFDAIVQAMKLGKELRKKNESK